MIGRFLSDDPLGVGGGWPNFQSYVGGGPVNRIDPTGTDFNSFVGVDDPMNGDYNLNAIAPGNMQGGDNSGSYTVGMKIGPGPEPGQPAVEISQNSGVTSINAVEPGNQGTNQVCNHNCNTQQNTISGGNGFSSG